MSVLTIHLEDVLQACQRIVDLTLQGHQPAAEEAKREAGPVFSEFFAVPGNLRQANADSAIRFERNTNNLIDVHHAGLAFSIRV